MGEVYKARDTRLERAVAIKVLPTHLSSSPESRQRFEREAKTISQLTHPHVCALYDVGHEGEVEYLRRIAGRQAVSRDRPQDRRRRAPFERRRQLDIRGRQVTLTAGAADYRIIIV